MSASLLFFAGEKAFHLIREKGLHPEMVKLMVNAAGGPRWLIYYHLDRALFSSWLGEREDPLFLLGSSAGAWRFAAACGRKPAEAIDRFLAVYLDQRYPEKPSPTEASQIHVRMLNDFLDDDAVAHALEHPFLRLSIMAARCKWPVASENGALLRLGMADAVLYNAVNRGGLKFFFERALFYDSRDLPPFFQMNDLPIQRIPLSRRNLKHAVLASGSVPLLMSGVRNIPGAPRGTYRDGGVVDYHFDVPFLKDEDKIALFPHFTDRIIPSWFDKQLPWRKPSPSNLENVLLLHPGETFIKRLPMGKLPDKRDFWLFKGQDQERSLCWKKAAEEGERLADEFLNLAESGRIRDRVKPLPR